MPLTQVLTKKQYKRNAHDLYQTEKWATRALLDYVRVHERFVWEPAAGHHKIAEVLAEYGAHVITSDITRYSKPHSLFGRRDFLSNRLRVPPGVQLIITNPPYGVRNNIAKKFVERALQVCDGTVCMLLTAKFDSASSRVHLFRNSPRFKAKVVLTDRLSLMLNGRSGTEDHAWYIWAPVDEPHMGPAELYYAGKKGNVYATDA